MAETTEKINFQIGSQGTEQFISALAKVDQTLEQLGKETEKTGDGFDRMGKKGAKSLLEISQAAQAAAGNRAFPEMKTRIAEVETALDRIGSSAGKFTGALSAVSNTLAQASPELGSFAQSITRSTSALNNMSMLFGGGAGLIAGGIVAALQILIKKFSEATEESDKLGGSLNKTLNPATQKLLAITGYDAAHKQAAEDIAKHIAGQRAASLNRSQLLADTDPNSQANIRKTQAADKAIQDKYENENAGLIGDNPGKAKQGHGDTEYQAELATIAKAEEQFRKKQEKELMATEDAILKDRVDAKKQANDEFAKLNQQRFDHELHAARSTDKELAKLDNDAMKRNRMMRDVAMDAWTSIGSVGIQSLSALVQGQKVSMKAVVASIGDAMVASGTRALFEGLAINAAPFSFGAGTPLITVGLEEIGAGLTFGAGSRLFGGAAGGGAGGGGRQSGPGFYGDRWFQDRPSAIEPSARLSGDAGAGGNTYVVNQQSLVPDAHAGVRAHAAMREAKRQGLI